MQAPLRCGECVSSLQFEGCIPGVAELGISSQQNRPPTIQRLTHKQRDDVEHGKPQCVCVPHAAFLFEYQQQHLPVILT